MEKKVYIDIVSKKCIFEIKYQQKFIKDNYGALQSLFILRLELLWSSCNDIKMKAKT